MLARNRNNKIFDDVNSQGRRLEILDGVNKGAYEIKEKISDFFII